MSSLTPIETFMLMRYHERNEYKKVDFLWVARRKGVPVRIDQQCRDSMVDWCCHVCKTFRLSSEVVEIAMDILGRFLVTLSGRAALQNAQVFQLAGISCLFMASKIYGLLELTPDDLCTLAKIVCTEKNIVQMEWNICAALQFHVIRAPTSFGFIDTFLNLVPMGQPQQLLTEKRRELAKYLCHFQAREAVKKYQFVGVPASIIAFCSVVNACRVMGIEAKMNDEDELAFTKEMLTFTDENEIADICDILYHVAGLEQWKIMLNFPHEHKSADGLASETNTTMAQQPRPRRRLIQMVHTLFTRRKSHRAK
jgi:hypothetical protein